ncbi:glycosyl transferase group 1 [Pyrolobus fumarii 1A]|uniref:Glycosyl transferase group 1 n=1 Tax=Pyrolobus fumarii (strain DSM 11204 / 1A) TaxID=694429 RepID=G0EHG8_PYRF1|nr:glycosyltransferase family 1 protein [Pyrolobus fumarii]AEM38543.1 glycosyl transferase group 1 [Pyrolobus fumarii 1A]
MKQRYDIRRFTTDNTETDKLRILIMLKDRLPASFSNYIRYLAEGIRRIAKSRIELLFIHINDFKGLACKDKGHDRIVLHIPFLGDGSYPRLYDLLKAKMCKMKVVVTLHGFNTCAARHELMARSMPCPHEYCSTKRVLYDVRKKILWNIISRIALVDAIITPSWSEKNVLMKCLGIPEKRIYVIHHGVDTDLYRPRSRKECSHILAKYKIGDSYILHVSNYQPVKNVERIVAAYALLKRKFGIKEKLVIAGRQPRERILRLAISLGLNPRDIIFTGVVSRDDLPCLYSAAKVLVMPSIHESFGMPILEAMACGCPVVTSSVYACVEVSDNAALIVDPFDVKEIAMSVYKILADDELRAELIRRGITRTKSFTWEKSVLMHLKVYETVTGSR